MVLSRLHPPMTNANLSDQMGDSTYVFRLTLVFFVGQTALKKQLRAGAVPSVFWWKKPDHKKVVRNQQRERRREERHAGIAEEKELQRRLAAAQSGSEVRMRLLPFGKWLVYIIK